MRLFIAIMLSDDMKKAVTGTMHELKKADVRGSYVPAQNLHVTLAFIGETKDASWAAPGKRFPCPRQGFRRIETATAG